MNCNGSATRRKGRLKGEIIYTFSHFKKHSLSSILSHFYSVFSLINPKKLRFHRLFLSMKWAKASFYENIRPIFVFQFHHFLTAKALLLGLISRFLSNKKHCFCHLISLLLLAKSYPFASSTQCFYLLIDAKAMLFLVLLALKRNHIKIYSHSKSFSQVSFFVSVSSPKIEKNYSFRLKNLNN